MMYCTSVPLEIDIVLILPVLVFGTAVRIRLFAVVCIIANRYGYIIALFQMYPRVAFRNWISTRCIIQLHAHRKRHDQVVLER
jgi:hypothetical protein